MLEYFTYKKYKKHKVEEEAKKEKCSETPVLTEDDEQFLERIVSEEGTPPPLPARPQVILAGDASDSAGETELVNESTPQNDASKDKGKGKAKDVSHEKKSGGHFAWFQRKNKDKEAADLHEAAERVRNGEDQVAAPEGVVTADEEQREEKDIEAVLERLNLAAEGTRAFSLSKESQVLVQKFTVILKDLVNGVPTAYDDLVALLTNSEQQLQKTYTGLPSFLKKLVKSLPSKLTSSLAPELLAVASEGAALSTEGASSGRLKLPSLKDLVTKPGAVIGQLKGIMNVLKLRWPAFMGTNVLWSLGLFVLLFVFWYCHKRGRDVRLERESAETLAAEAELEAMADSVTSTGTADAAPSGSVIEPKTSDGPSRS